MLALCLSFSVVAESHSQSGEEAAIRALIDRYFAAYAKEDLDAIGQLWSDKSPDLAQTKARLKDLFSLNNQIETRNLSLGQFKVDGERASTRATVEVSGIDVKTSTPTTGLGKMIRVLSFVKGAGELEKYGATYRRRKNSPPEWSRLKVMTNAGHSYLKNLT